MAWGIYQPGRHDRPAYVYDGDPAPGVSLSRSVAHTLLEKSPRHAMLEHRRLNPQAKPAQRTDFDLGSAAHTLMLGDEWRFRFIDAANDQTKAAEQARDEARERRQVPVLSHQGACC